MAFILDTNVISELRKKSRCHSNVIAWQASVSLADCHVSIVSLMEIRLGVLKAKRTNAEFGDALEQWYENVLKPGFTGRILTLDLPITERCSMLMSQRTRGMADALIASTALIHALTLVTRNTDDFKDTGISLVNPWIS